LKSKSIWLLVALAAILVVMMLTLLGSRTGKVKHAVVTNDVIALQQYLTGGFDPNKRVDQFGSTLLQYAVMDPNHKDNQPLVELLIAHGADVNLANNQGVTALALASTYGRADLAQILVAKGANVNAKAADGSTPLSRALTMHNQAMITLLQNHGAAP
jgi:uncharacterized protein